MQFWYFVIFFFFQITEIGQTRKSSTPLFYADTSKYQEIGREYDSNKVKNLPLQSHVNVEQIVRLRNKPIGIKSMRTQIIKNTLKKHYNSDEINPRKDVYEKVHKTQLQEAEPMNLYVGGNNMKSGNISEKTADTWTIHMCRRKDAIGKKFKDPMSKTHYYNCMAENIVVRMPCPLFTVYDEASESCQTSDIDTSPCKGCLNGGDCVITESGYECKCAYNYEGEHCENHIKRCEPNPCAEGGRCYEISTAPGYICECADKIFDTCCCHDIENKCAHLPRRFYSEKGRMFIHCSRDGYAFVKFCPPGMVFNDYRQTCTFKTKWQDEDFKTVQNPDFYKQTDNEEYYDRSRDRDQQPPYIFNQSAPHAFY